MIPKKNTIQNYFSAPKLKPQIKSKKIEFKDLSDKDQELATQKLIPYSDIHRKNEPNTWYETEFFEFKGFKKGTAHIKFKDIKLWEYLNRKYAEIKGNVLPEKI